MEVAVLHDASIFVEASEAERHKMREDLERLCAKVRRLEELSQHDRETIYRRSIAALLDDVLNIGKRHLVQALYGGFYSPACNSSFDAALLISEIAFLSSSFLTTINSQAC